MIQTERLTIRIMEADDSAFIVELLNEPDFINFIGDKMVRTEQDAERYMRDGPLTCQKQNGFSLMTVSLHSGEQIGMCGLLKRDNLAHPDIGYAFLSKYYRQGYAHEACLAVLNHFSKIRPLLAITDEGNEASKQLLIKLGFSLQATSTLEYTDNVCQFLLPS